MLLQMKFQLIPEGLQVLPVQLMYAAALAAVVVAVVVVADVVAVAAAVGAVSTLNFVTFVDLSCLALLN